MKIGIPKEIKNNENRVAMTPSGVHALIEHGHEVWVETQAGNGSQFSDAEYQGVGAVIMPNAAQVWQADMVLKVKEPLAEEFVYFRPDLLLFTYLHLAAAPELTRALIDKQVTGIAYETVQTADGQLPLLAPMSEVAGRMSVQVGAQFLQKFYGGKGVLLGGVPGVPKGIVTILGGGVAGTEAAKMALGLGAEVIIIDTNPKRLKQLSELFGGHIHTLMSTPMSIAKSVKRSDLVIGSVLIPGASAPKLVTEEMIADMDAGGVVVDIAIDQGGCIATTDHVTTHDNPTYIKHGVLHYAVANMPGAVPRTSTMALTNATLPYVQTLADAGLTACHNDKALLKGINTYHGYVTYQSVAQALNYNFKAIEDVLS